MITSAPVAFSLLIGLGWIVIWYVLKWRFQHIIATRDGTIQIHEERHKAKDEKLAEVFDKVERGSPKELADAVIALRENLDRRDWNLGALHDKPDIIASIVHPAGPHKPDAPFDILLRLELNNRGGEGRIGGWTLNIDSHKGPVWAILPKKTLYIDDPQGSGISPGDAVIAPLPSSSQRIPARDIFQVVVRFSISTITWARATEKGTEWIVDFEDNTGRTYTTNKTW